MFSWSVIQYFYGQTTLVEQSLHAVPGDSLIAKGQWAQLEKFLSNNKYIPERNRILNGREVSQKGHLSNEILTFDYFEFDNTFVILISHKMNEWSDLHLSIIAIFGPTRHYTMI